MSEDHKEPDRKDDVGLLPPRIEIAFVGEDGARQTLIYERSGLPMDDPCVGLRYGEAPDQPAALYKLINGNIVIGGVRIAAPEGYLTSAPDMVKPGTAINKNNLIDVDEALNILKHLTEKPACIIVKHNNPCAVAIGPDLQQACRRAFLADPNGPQDAAVVLNGPVDKDLASLLVGQNIAVLVAPEMTVGAMESLSQETELRVLRMTGMEKLKSLTLEPYMDFWTLIDGGIVVQWSPVMKIHSANDLKPAATSYQGKEFRIRRKPTEQEINDMLFGWAIQEAAQSCCAMFVKEGVTVGISAGELNRAEAVEAARDRAYRKLAERLSRERFNLPYNAIDDPGMKTAIDDDVRELHGNLMGSVLVSDGYFSSPEVVEIALAEGARAFIQPGGSPYDHEIIMACNEANATMVFTGARRYGL